MAKSHIRSSILSAFIHVAGYDTDYDTSLIQDNTPIGSHLDSLDIVELSVSIEDTFNIAVLDDDTDSWVVFGDIVDYVHDNVMVKG